MSADEAKSTPVNASHASRPPWRRCFYPVALHALYGAGRLVQDATSPESALSAWTVTIGAAAVVYSVPSNGLDTHETERPTP